jgi:hypothetical protein
MMSWNLVDSGSILPAKFACWYHVIFSIERKGRGSVNCEHCLEYLCVESSPVP